MQLACGNGCYQYHVGKDEQRGAFKPSLPRFSFCKSITAMAQHSRRGRAPVESVLQILCNIQLIVLSE